MNRIEWSAAARQDLRDIRAHIARDSAQYARRFVDRIKAAVQGTQRFPAAAARVPDWDREDVREIFVGQYRILFRFDEDVVYVLAVIHAARRLPDIEIE